MTKWYLRKTIWEKEGPNGTDEGPFKSYESALKRMYKVSKEIRLPVDVSSGQAVIEGDDFTYWIYGENINEISLNSMFR